MVKHVLSKDSKLCALGQKKRVMEKHDTSKGGKESAFKSLSDCLSSGIG